MVKPLFIKTILSSAVIANLLYWKLFDVAMVSLLVLLLVDGKKTLHLLKSTWTHSRVLLSLCAALLFVILLGYVKAGTPSEIFNFRWIFGFLLISLAIQSLEINRLNLAPLFIAVTLTLLGIVIYETRFFHIPYERYHRLQGLYNNPNVMGLAAMLCFSFVLGWFAILMFEKRKFTTSAMILMFALTAIIYLTLSRSTWIGYPGCAVILGIFYFRDRFFYIPAFLSAVFIVLAFSINLLGFKERILYSADFDKASTSAIRLEIWKANLTMFRESPWLGVGYWHNAQMLKDYVINVPADDLHAHAHNQYLQFLAGAGVFGLLLYTTILLYSLSYFIKVYRTEKDFYAKQAALSAFLVLTSYTLESLTDSPMDSREVRNFLMLTLGTAVGIIVSRKKTTEPAADSEALSSANYSI